MENPQTNSGLKFRLIVALSMLALGFIGVIVTDISKNFAWSYWRIVSVIYAILSLILSWHLKRKGWKSTAVTIWHELAHWIGMIAAIFVSSYFVKIGIVAQFEASLFTLLLLALATYLAGVYIETTFVLIGIVLGCFAIALGFVNEYLYNIMLPIGIVAVAAVLLYFHHMHKRSKKEVP